MTEHDATQQPGSLKPFIRIGVVTFLAMVPVTLFPPMLRPLIQENFEVSDTLTHYFMSINMLGAIIEVMRWSGRQ